MCTQFVELEMALQPLPELVPAIEEALRAEGQPLRWAITKVEKDRVNVEAAVLTTAAQ